MRLMNMNTAECRLTSRRRTGVRAACLALLTACMIPTSGLAGKDSRTAKEVLASGGEEAGLCVHIGCGRDGSPGLTAELAARSKMLVHGICWDPQSLARARAAIAAKNVVGQASVETLADGPLPYVRHLCNLVVVEDMKAVAAHGVDRAELMRVLAPGGTL